jgi:hypothetical protein
MSTSPIDDLNKRLQAIYFDAEAQIQTICKNFGEIDQKTEQLSLEYSEKACSENEAVQLVELSDKISQFKNRYNALLNFFSEPYVVVKQAIVSEEDCIRSLTTFETEQSWKQKLENKNDCNTPCYLVRLSEIWNRISATKRDEIDQTISSLWEKRIDQQETMDIGRGRQLREEMGLNNSFIQDAIHSYCFRKKLYETRVVELKSNTDLPGVEKIAEILTCPVETTPTSDLSILVPCGHTISEKHIEKLQQKICPTCRGEFTATAPNLAARQIVDLMSLNKNSNSI